MPTSRFKSDLYWMVPLLLIAALWHVGLSLILFNAGLVSYGLIMLALGIACGLTAINPYQYWLVLLLAMIGELFLLAYLIWKILFAQAIVPYALPMMANGLWLVAFGQIFYRLSNYEEAHPEKPVSFQTLDEALGKIFISDKQATLKEMSYRSPLLIIFLRYIGCTFCRETLHEISQKKAELTKQGFAIVFVHLNAPEEAQETFERYGLSDSIQISDPNRNLYRLFGIKRAKWSELANACTIKKAFKSSFLEGHGQGPISGDPLQMPGVFVVYQARIIYSYASRFVGDEPNYTEIEHVKAVNNVLNEVKNSYDESSKHSS